ncbi:MAG: helix-turn-helix transcriptional regulator [Lawsonibacter sp.]|nr:helix-turn-helix transcriptional regulator [Lawsonibacter sp.]
MEEKRPFGDYIRKKRLEAGLTQKELAGRLFVTESSVSKWERNLSYPDVSLVTAICRELGISEHEFFTACDDLQAQAQARAAAVWRGVVTGSRRLFIAGCLIAIPVCFVVELAVFHTLDWFWIVLASLVLPLGWWAIWRFCGKHVLPLCVTFTSVWVFPLLAVINGYTGGGWLWRSAFPLAALGVVFLWAYFLCLAYWNAGPWRKAGVCALITAAASPAFGWLCRWVVPEAVEPWLLDYLTPAALAVLGLVLLAVGAARERRPLR